MCMRFRALILSLGVLALIAPRSSAQDLPDRINKIQTSLVNAKAAYDQLSDDMKKKVKPNGALLRLSAAVARLTPGLSTNVNASWQPSPGWDDGEADENGLVQVNNPARDLRFSPFVGYTQTDASTARCGQSVVVAFSDSGSILETLISGSAGVTSINGIPPPSATGGLSAAGYATSSNGGTSFNDRGAVNPGPDPLTFLLGSPSVACSDSGRFYMVQQAKFKPGAPFQPQLSGVAISLSNDGGVTWNNPVPAVKGDPTSFLSFLEDFTDTRVAVDPTNHNRIYVAYIHQNFAFCSIFGLSPQTTVEVIVSNDGGQTFDPNPTIVDSQCAVDTDLTDVGARMAISSQGIVYVAWEVDFFNQSASPVRNSVSFNLIPVAIEVGSFAPSGRPLPPAIVDSVFPLRGSLVLDPEFGFGNVFEVPFFEDNSLPALQGGFLNLRGFDLAVDTSGGSTDGNVYVAWDDGRNGAFGAFELEDFLFSYSFTDILFSSSSDGGQTFTPTRRLNSDAQPLTSRGRDHFRPVLSVDRKGNLAACWYDRRNDPQNYQFERFCAESSNAGATWREFNIPGSLSTPSTQQDWLILRPDMGSNDDLTTDFMGHNPGFLGGILFTSSGMNPDIKLVKFQ